MPRLDGWCSRIPHTFPTSRACPGAEAPLPRWQPLHIPWGRCPLCGVPLKSLSLGKTLFRACCLWAVSQWAAAATGEICWGGGGRGWNWGCYGNPEGVLPGRRRCCVWGTEGSGTATAPGAQGRGELGCPQTVTVLRVLTPATCARGYGALRSKPQPVRWGHSGDAYEPLQVAPRLQLSPGGGCQGGDLRAQKADSEDILEQMSIPDSTSLP